MGLKDYFSRDEDRRARFIFDLIAPFYGLIDRALVEHYRDTAAVLDGVIPLKDLAVLDVGTGTGGWLAALAAYPLRQATGIDMSGRMVRQAEKRHPGLTFLEGDGKKMQSFRDGEYDLVTCSFVMHGMKQEARERMLEEMFRVASLAVVVHDFHDPLPWATRLLENMERSDYKHFLENFTAELSAVAARFRVVRVDRGNALYIGWK